MILELILTNQTITIPEMRGIFFFFFNDRRQVCYKMKIIRAALKMLLRPFSETIFRWWQCYLSFEGYEFIA